MRVAPYSGGTWSWLVSSLFWVALFAILLSGRTPSQLYDELWGTRRAFTAHDVALLRAAGEGDVDATRRALADGARVDAVEPETLDTPLVRAARASHAPVVELLLREGADAGQRANQNRTALDEAVEHASPEVVRLLLATKPDVNREGGDRDRTPIAVAVGRYRDARQAARAVSPAVRDSAAAETGHATTKDAGAVSDARQIIRLLLDAGADASRGGGQGRGRPPIVDAIRGGFGDVVTMLLEAGANAGAIDEPSGDTLLALAVDTCAPAGPAIVAALLAHGAHPDARGASGRTGRERLRASASTREDCSRIRAEIARLF